MWAGRGGLREEGVGTRAVQGGRGWQAGVGGEGLSAGRQGQGSLVCGPGRGAWGRRGLGPGGGAGCVSQCSVGSVLRPSSAEMTPCTSVEPVPQRHHAERPGPQTSATNGVISQRPMKQAVPRHLSAANETGSTTMYHHLTVYSHDWRTQ